MRIAAIQCQPIFDDVSAACAVIVQRLRWASDEDVPARPRPPTEA